MSMLDDDVALLVDRYLDGELSIKDRNELAADHALAQRFIAELRFQGCVGGLLRQNGKELLGHVEDALALGKSTVLADRVLARIPSRRYRNKNHHQHRGWWLWTAGSVLAAGIAFVVILNVNTPSGVTASVADGTRSADQPINLTFGSLLEMNANQEAQVAFKDGTQMELSATSSMRISAIDKGGARIALENGSVSAVVSKQPNGSHFQVATKEALLTVIGTKFTATKMPWGTRVEVTEGRVHTRRASDGKEVEVDAGNRVDIGHGPMKLLPIFLPIPKNALLFEPLADAIVVAGKYSNENRGLRPSHVVTHSHHKQDEAHDYYLTFNLGLVKKAPRHAELRLHLTLLKNTGMKLRIARINQAWGEKTITWNNRPPRGDIIAAWSPDQQDTAIDVTKVVALAMGSQLSLCLYMDENEKADAIIGFHTREAAPLFRPQLVIEE